MSLIENESFLQHLKNYASYTFLRSFTERNEPANEATRTALNQALAEYEPLYKASLAYLASVSPEEREELFSQTHAEQLYGLDLPGTNTTPPDEDDGMAGVRASVSTTALLAMLQSDFFDFVQTGDTPPEDTFFSEVTSKTRSGPRPKPRDIFSVHSSAPVYDIGETIARGNFVITPEAPFPTASIVGGTQGRIDILPFWDHANNQPLTPQTINLVANNDDSEFSHMQEEAVRIATSYNEEMATYFYAMDAYWLMNAKGPDDYVDLQISDLLQYTGKKPVKTHGKYTGTYRGDQLQRAGMMVYGMGFSMVEIERAIVKGVGERTHYKRLWDVQDMYMMETLDSEKYIESMTYRPNELLRNVSFGNRRETALLMSKVLSLDYAKMVVARRLGRYYTWLWRDRARTGKIDAPVTCSRLLERAGVEVEKGKERYARRSLESALDRLETEGIIAQWVLLDAQNQPADVSGRVSFTRWCEMKISVSPPDTILLHYTGNITLPDAEPGAGNKPDVDLSRLNEERKRRGYTLAMLSEETGVELSTLSRITTGKTKRPRAEHVKAINAWLQKQDAGEG